MVSVLITTYNSASTILSTLSAISNQTFTGFEVVVVDDGSADDTCKLVQAFGDTRIRLLQPGKLGRAGALNFGVQQCRFPWVAVCDSDDIWHPQKLELQLDFVRNNPECDLVATNSLLFTQEEQIVFEQPINKDQAPVIPLSLSGMLRVNKVSHSSVLVRKELARYNEKRNSQVDYELWLRLLAAGKYRLVLYFLPLTFHRIHANQSFESKGFAYRMKSISLVNHYAIRSLDLLTLLVNNLKVPYYLLSRLRIRRKAGELPTT